MLKLEKIWSGYRLRPVIEDINFSVKNGETVSIIGKNSCGKSTLLKTAAGLIMPIRGCVFLDNLPMTEYSGREVAAKIAYMPQIHTASAITVEELVCYSRFPYLKFGHPMGENDISAVNNAIKLAGLSSLRMAPLDRLSSGQRQLAYIAAVLAQETDILLLDEPTAFLDISYQLKIMKVVSMLKSLGKTVIMVLHDIEFAIQFSDRVLIMSEGKVILDSSSSNLPAEALNTAFDINHSREDLVTLM
ncbi:MAG: ABC transporter ATP-binding protein [Bacillota bacterium]|nr:ABC transporter ATP-binding protein [Bacillota bacterium]